MDSRTARHALASVVLLGASACGSDPHSVGLFGEGTGGASADASAGSSDGSEGTSSDPSAPATGAESADETADSAGPIFDVAMGDTDGVGEGGDDGSGCAFIDVLFVVDISASMQEEKANLAANFPMFVEVLDDYVAADGNAEGYRVGVTNSSVNADYSGCATTMGLDGALFAGSAVSGDCGTDGIPWLDGPAAGLAANFSCLAEQPIPGNGGSDCGKERPLDVLEMFVEKSTGGPNEGFYRGDESLLVIVNLTDEDDDAEWTSTTPTQTKAVLDAFAAGEERYVVVTIAGPGPGQCESAFGEADEAVTLRAFTEMVPNGLFGDICQGDLTIALADALELIQTSCDVLPPPAG